MNDEIVTKVKTKIDELNKEIISCLKENKPIILKCPICASTDFNLYSCIVSLNIPLFDLIHRIALTCNNCGFERMHSTYSLGIDQITEKYVTKAQQSTDVKDWI